MKTVVVTGATGTIGTVATRMLIEEGNAVFGISSSTKPINISGPFTHVACDLTEPEQTLKALSDIDPVCIVHCAAVIPKAFSDEDPSGRINQGIDSNVIEFCGASRTRLIYISTTSIYSETKDVMEETSKVAPTGSYLKAKKLSEDRILSELDNYAILRVCAPYHQEQRASTVLKKFIENALANKPIQYHGSGARRQWFTSAIDIGRIIELAVRMDKVTGIFNVVGPESISMKELAALVKNVIPESKSPVGASGLPDPEENRNPVFSIEKARVAFGWVPEISLRDGIAAWAHKVSQ